MCRTSRCSLRPTVYYDDLSIRNGISLRFIDAQTGKFVGQRGGYRCTNWKVCATKRGRDAVGVVIPFLNDEGSLSCRSE